MFTGRTSLFATVVATVMNRKTAAITLMADPARLDPAGTAIALLQRTCLADLFLVNRR
jgi:hypothetical protein